MLPIDGVSGPRLFVRDAYSGDRRSAEMQLSLQVDHDIVGS